MLAIRKNQVRGFQSNDHPTLKPPTGRCYIVRSFQIYGVWQSFVDVTIDGVFLGRFLSNEYYMGGHVVRYTNQNTWQPVHRYMANHGLFIGYPVGENQEFALQLVPKMTITGNIVYDEYEAGVVDEYSVNGSKSDTLQCMTYGCFHSAINTTGSYKYDTSLMPSNFIGFPWTGPVPTGYSVDLNAIFFGDRATCDLNDVNDVISLKHYWRKNGQNLINDSDTGIAAVGIIDDKNPGGFYDLGVQPYGTYTNASPIEPLILHPAVHFDPADTLELTVDYGAKGGGISLNYWWHMCGLWVTINKLFSSED